MLALEAAPRSAPADKGSSYPHLGQAAHAFEALPATRVEHRSLLLQMSFAGSVVPRPLIRASFWQRFSFEASLSPVGGMSFSSPVFLRHLCFCVFLLLLDINQCLCFVLGQGRLLPEKLLEGAWSQ